MKLILLIVIFFIYGCMYCVAQNKTVCWSGEKRLKWEYYTGKPPKDGNYKDFSAVTSIIKNIEILWKDGLPYFKINSMVLQDESWKRDTSIGLLEHEQLHFDISELYARKIRCMADSLRNIHVQDIDVYINEKNKVLDEEDKTNRVYDSESCFSKCKPEQKRWKEKIASELKKLKKYASEHEDCE